MKKNRSQHPFRIAAWTMALLASSVAAEEVRRFQFSGDKAIDGATRVAPGELFSTARGYGYLDKAGEDTKAPRRFALQLPEGSYDVTVQLGNASQATETTVKAETRRLMLHGIATKPGEFVTRKFTVNIRRPEFGSGEKTRLKERESGPPMSPSWDDMLSLEFNGTQPGVVALQVEPTPAATTVFLAGDSTVTDQLNEPWAGWGQMLPSFFQPGVAISNHAESGLALFSFASQKRLEKILSMAKKGDYLFIQFGHNDQKDKREEAGAFTTYKKELESYVTAFREKGGIPVLVTPMERRRWKDGKPQQSLTEYAAAVRQVGKEMKLPVIDLHAMSLKLYGALGERGSSQAFVFYPANTFPDQKEELKDNTHHSAYGGYELARCVVEGIKAELPELAKRLRPELAPFDASRPDAPEQVAIPRSPVRGENATPDGS